MKNNKPTPAQQEVINHMAAGWQLGRNSGFGNRIPPREWLQKGGIGKGGESKPVRGGTVMSLTDKGLIKPYKGNYPVTTYVLTEEGRATLTEKNA